MFKLLLGRAGAGKTTAVLDRLCAAGPGQVLLVPEQQSHETERALCAAGGVAGKLYLDHNAGSTSSSGQRQDGEARKKEHPYE